MASAPSRVTSKAEAKLGQPGIGPRVSEFGRGVMMGVYVQDLMALDGGACMSNRRVWGYLDVVPRAPVKFYSY